LARSRRASVSVMPYRARSSLKKRVCVGSPPLLMWKASMTLLKPSRTVTSASCVASSSPRLRERHASRNRLRADVLCRSSARRCSQMLAAYGTDRSSSRTNVCYCAARLSSARPRANL
jgi:hypothetical protein